MSEVLCYKCGSNTAVHKLYIHSRKPRLLAVDDLNNTNLPQTKQGIPRAMPAVVHGFFICGDCESQLNLTTDETVKRHMLQRSNFEQEAKEKLTLLERDYAGKKIRLLRILGRIKGLQR